MAGVQSSLREANRVAVLDAVRRFGGLTQVELAATTGLSPATVSTIVRELLAMEAVVTTTAVRNGRRAVMVTLHRRAGLVVGVHVGERHLEVMLVDAAYEVLDRHVLPLPHQHRADTTLDRLALLVVELVQRVGASLDDVLGIGIGLPAPVDLSTGLITVPGVMPGWQDVPVAETVAARLHRPVFVDNDANLGALGELRRGVGRDWQDLLYVRVSHGVGAGIVLGGAVHRGFAGTAGEIGHARVAPAGDICLCGSRGCLNTVVGARALLAPLAAGHGPLTLQDLVDGAVAGDFGCVRVVADAAAVIGDVVANLLVALNSRAVVVGGELARTGEVLLRPIREATLQRVPLARVAPPVVVQAQLGAAAEVTGAIALVLAETGPSFAANRDTMSLADT